MKINGIQILATGRTKDEFSSMQRDVIHHHLVMAWSAHYLQANEMKNWKREAK